jgi:hypothetical protein
MQLKNYSTWRTSFSAISILHFRDLLIINDVLPEASAQFREHRSETDFVVEKWKTAPPDIINKAAKRLHTAVRLVENATLLTIVFAIVLICGLCTLCTMANSILDVLTR